MVSVAVCLTVAQGSGGCKTRLECRWTKYTFRGMCLDVSTTYVVLFYVAASWLDGWMNDAGTVDGDAVLFGRVMCRHTFAKGAHTMSDRGTGMLGRG